MFILVSVKYPPETSLIDLQSDKEIEIEKVQIRDFPKDGVFVGVFYRTS